MNCIKFTIRSQDKESGTISNGYFRLDAQVDLFSDQLIKKSKKFKICVSKFITTKLDMSANETTMPYVEVKFINLIPVNSYICCKKDNVVLRCPISFTIENPAKISNMLCNYCNDNVQSNSIGLIMNDFSLLYKGLINIVLTESETGNEIIFDDTATHLQHWMLEFFVFYE